MALSAAIGLSNCVASRIAFSATDFSSRVSVASCRTFNVRFFGFFHVARHAFGNGATSGFAPEPRPRGARIAASRGGAPRLRRFVGFVAVLGTAGLRFFSRARVMHLHHMHRMY
jgi:hypothetical protein